MGVDRPWRHGHSLPDVLEELLPSDDAAFVACQKLEDAELAKGEVQGVRLSLCIENRSSQTIEVDGQASPLFLTGDRIRGAKGGGEAGSDSRTQLRRVERFLQIILSPDREGENLVLGLVSPREEDHRDVSQTSVVSNLGTKLIAVTIGKTDIDHDHLGKGLPYISQCSFQGVGERHFVVRLERRTNQKLLVGRIFDDEDARLSVRGRQHHAAVSARTGCRPIERRVDFPNAFPGFTQVFHLAVLAVS